MAAGVALFALPLHVPVRALLRPAAWWRRVAWRTALIVPAVLALGLLLLRVAHVALHRRVQPLLRHAALHRRRSGSRAMPLAQPLAAAGAQRDAGAHGQRSAAIRPSTRCRSSPAPLVAVLSVAGVPRLRDLPAAPCCSSSRRSPAPSLPRGWAYTGRFSMHVMPITCALTVCAAASIVGRGRPRIAVHRSHESAVVQEHVLEPGHPEQRPL